jgi:hypothetical protein
MEPHRVWWCMTAESGRVPVCRAGKACVTYAVRRPSRVARRAYVIVKTARHGRNGQVLWSTLLAPLSAESVDIVYRRMAPMFRTAVLQGASSCTGQLVEAVRRGMFSCGEECECTGWTATGICALCELRGRRFVAMDCFSGVYPCGEQHWFTGVTDAAGLDVTGGGEWLRCWCTR